MNTHLSILLTGSLCNDEFDWSMAPLPAGCTQVSSDDPDARFDEPCSMSFFEHLFDDCEPVDGGLQDAIDYGAEVQELIDAREDETFWAQGGW